ncbi:MAG: alpha-L-fucosidase, partial [Planctomycetota bacterium]
MSSRFSVLCVPVVTAFACCLASGASRAVAGEAIDVPAERLAAREAFRNKAFGIFIHFGAYSVGGEHEWHMKRKRMTVDEYREQIVEKFNPVDYDPAEWVDVFKKSGAQYVTITSKHHDGFALFDSKLTDWDVVDSSPYGKDILKMLADACGEADFPLFFYHSHLDWHHPDYFPFGSTANPKGKEKGRWTAGREPGGDFGKYIDFMNGQLAELLCGAYGPIGGIWFDGWWEQRDRSSKDVRATRVDWELDRTYALIHALQPACLIGNNHHVPVFDGEDFQMFERDLPGAEDSKYGKDSVISDLPLETCDTMNKHWGWNATDDAWKSPKELIHYLVRSSGQNANLLMNVGPKPDGTLPPESVERLLAMGAWLEEYGEAIYGTRGGPAGSEAWGVTTAKGDTIYVHLLDVPEADDDGFVTLSGTAGLADGL